MSKKRVPQPRLSSTLSKRESSHQVISDIQPPSTIMYQDYNEFQKRITKLKLPQNWSVFPNLEYTLIKKDDGSFILVLFVKSMRIRNCISVYEYLGGCCLKNMM